jgi:hypothetical protein
MTPPPSPEPAPKYPSRVADQFQVRFPDGMRDQIAQAAKDSGRSMNAEIVARLQESFSARADEEVLKPLLDTLSELRMDRSLYATVLSICLPHLSPKFAKENSDMVAYWSEKAARLRASETTKVTLNSGAK